MAQRNTKLDQLREWTSTDSGESLARQWRRAAGLTTTQAAARVGVSSRSIERYEAGATPREPALVDQLHKFLKSIRPQEEK